MLGGWGGYEIVKISKAIYRYMESKKKSQFYDNFEIFILCFSVSHGAIEQLISFLFFHISYLHNGFPLCRVKYSLNLNYPKKLTHGKDSQCIKFNKVQSQRIFRGKFGFYRTIDYSARYHKQLVWGIRGS
jgi:hypothetical protein